MTAWVLGGKALKRLFLCSHSINGFFCLFTHPLKQKNKKIFKRGVNNLRFLAISIMSFLFSLFLFYNFFFLSLFLLAVIKATSVS